MSESVNCWVNYWVMQPELWVIFGIVLIILELLIGAAYFLLALGIAALLLALVLVVQDFEVVVLLSDWMDITISYAMLSLLAVGILKFFVQDKPSSEDINKY